MSETVPSRLPPPSQQRAALSTITHKSKSGRRRHIHKPGNEALCKYSSKACYEPRVVKRSGGMHRYCEHHRLQANRNQRRLEQRRRVHEELAAAASTVASPQGGSGGGDGSPPHAYNYSADEGSASVSSSGGGGNDDDDDWLNTSLSEIIFEPFRHPQPLQDDDLSNLRSILDESSAPRPPLHQQQQHHTANPTIQEAVYVYEL